MKKSFFFFQVVFINTGKNASIETQFYIFAKKTRFSATYSLQICWLGQTSLLRLGWLHGERDGCSLKRNPRCLLCRFLPCIFYLKESRLFACRGPSTCCRRRRLDSCLQICQSRERWWLSVHFGFAAALAWVQLPLDLKYPRFERIWRWKRSVRLTWNIRLDVDLHSSFMFEPRFVNLELCRLLWVSAAWSKASALVKSPWFKFQATSCHSWSVIPLELKTTILRLRHFYSFEKNDTSFPIFFVSIPSNNKFCDTDFPRLKPTGFWKFLLPL